MAEFIDEINEIVGRPAAELTDAERARVRCAGDRVVFGIPLGEPLRLPVCTGQQLLGTGMAGPVPGPSCELRGLMGTTASATLLNAFRAPRGASGVVVKLGMEACPQWVTDGSVLFTVVDGRAEAATFEVNESPVDQLTKKYGPSKGEPSFSCTSGLSRKGAQWEDSRVVVAYSPFSPRTCNFGYVTVQTKKFKAFVKQQADSGPKM
jgi:hypothetical protein